MATKKTSKKPTRQNPRKKTTSKKAPTKRPADKAAARASTSKAAKGRTSATVEKKPAKPAGKAKSTKKATRGNPAATSASKKPGRVSLLDAAAQVLAKAKQPMNCKAIVEMILKQGNWKTSGKTPQATLYSAILREIQNKGNESRFKKVDRGQFTLSTKR